MIRSTSSPSLNAASTFATAAAAAANTCKCHPQPPPSVYFVVRNASTAPAVVGLFRTLEGGKAAASALRCIADDVKLFSVAYGAVDLSKETSIEF